MTGIGSAQTFVRCARSEASFHVNAKEAHRTFDFYMTDKELDGSEVTRGFVDDLSFRAPKRVRSVVLSRKADAGHGHVPEASISPRAHMSHLVVPTGTRNRRELLTNVPTTRASLSEPIHQFELDRALRLLLHNDCSISNAPTEHDIANPNRDHIAIAQLAIGYIGV